MNVKFDRDESGDDVRGNGHAEHGGGDDDEPGSDDFAEAQVDVRFDHY